MNVEHCCRTFPGLPDIQMGDKRPHRTQMIIAPVHTPGTRNTRKMKGLKRPLSPPHSSSIEADERNNSSTNQRFQSTTNVNSNFSWVFFDFPIVPSSFEWRSGIRWPPGERGREKGRRRRHPAAESPNPVNTVKWKRRIQGGNEIINGRNGRREGKNFFAISCKWRHIDGFLLLLLLLLLLVLLLLLGLLVLQLLVIVDGCFH